MNEFGMPIVELRLKHLGQEIIHAFAMYEGELNGYIKKSVEALMTDAYIQEEIDRLCYDCMKECIKEVFESAAVKRDLTAIMTEQVLARLSGNTPVAPPTAPTVTKTPPPEQSEDDFWVSVNKGA